MEKRNIIQETCDELLNADNLLLSDEETLRIYDAEINMDRRNIDNIDKMINESDVGSANVMFIRENGSGVEPTITEESRKKSAKSLIK